MNELPDDLIMNLDRLGKANRLPRQALDPRSEIQILPLNTLGVTFSDQMFIFWEIALISLPTIGTVQGHAPRFDQG